MTTLEVLRPVQI